jgi:hypothetical protein
MKKTAEFRSITACLLACIVLSGCTAIDIVDSGLPAQTPGPAPLESPTAMGCPVTEPSWAKPPEDDAIPEPPVFGYYYVNPDRSIWASAWWTDSDDPLRVSEEGLKTGWFRPAGAALEITGRRLDGQAPALEVNVPCCYPTRFQASGLYFPTEGCWEVIAKAAGSELRFVVKVEP